MVMLVWVFPWALTLSFRNSKGGCPDEVTYFQEPPCLTQGPFLSALGFALRGFSTESLLHSGKAEESLPICCSEKEP